MSESDPQSPTYIPPAVVEACSSPTPPAQPSTSRPKRAFSHHCYRCWRAGGNTGHTCPHCHCEDYVDPDPPPTPPVSKMKKKKPQAIGGDDWSTLSTMSFSDCMDYLTQHRESTMDLDCLVTLPPNFHPAQQLKSLPELSESDQYQFVEFIRERITAQLKPFRWT